jgi:hypothetical protein
MSTTVGALSCIPMVDYHLFAKFFESTRHGRPGIAGFDQIASRASQREPPRGIAQQRHHVAREVRRRRRPR